MKYGKFVLWVGVVLLVGGMSYFWVLIRQKTDPGLVYNDTDVEETSGFGNDSVSPNEGSHPKANRTTQRGNEASVQRRGRFSGDFSGDLSGQHSARLAVDNVPRLKRGLFGLEISQLTSEEIQFLASKSLRELDAEEMKEEYE